MPVMNSLKFRKSLNKRLAERDRAKNRTIAAEHELKRAQHHISTLPTSVSQNPKQREEALKNRDRKMRLLQKLESSHTGEAVELASAERKLRGAKNFRKGALVGGIRLGRTIADILLGSNKVSVVTKNMGRVFSTVKKSNAKKPVVVQRYHDRLTFKKGTPSKVGPMLGRSPRK